MKDFLYYGLFLDEQSKKYLKQIYPKYFCKQTLDKIEKVYLDHVTLLFNNPKQYGQKQFEDIKYVLDHLEEGTKFPLIIEGIGRNDKALAFKVDFPIPFRFLNFTGKAHITIATINGGKPVESNYIDWWNTIKPIELLCTFRKKLSTFKH